VWSCLAKMVVHNPKKVKIISKIVNYVFIKYTYNNTAYLFIIHKSSIGGIHSNTIMESRNAIFFKDVFLFKETQEDYSFKITIQINLSDYHSSKDKTKPRRSKKEINKNI